MDSSLFLLPELCTADYHVYRYRADYYKVVRFKSIAPRCGPRVRKHGQEFIHEDKLPAAISRARRVCLELALCNEWKWFSTLTVAASNFDRKNLKEYYSHFTDWLKYRSKKLGVSIPYLLVPEQHGDGSWHMHGFFTAAIDPLLVSFKSMWESGAIVPYKLVAKDYYNLPAYQSRFGFCSFGQIRDHIACAHYTTKYISKSFLGDARKVGLKLYFCSQGLNRATFSGGVFGPCPGLDVYLTHHYEFCSTGFAWIDRQPGDDPIMDLIEQNQAQMQPMDLTAFMRERCSVMEIPENDACSDDFYQICIVGMDG